MVGYTHLVEFLPGKASLYTGILFFLDGMVAVVTPLIIMFGIKNMNIFIYIPLGVCLFVLMIFGLLYVPESIKYTLENGKVS